METTKFPVVLTSARGRGGGQGERAAAEQASSSHTILSVERGLNVEALGQKMRK